MRCVVRASPAFSFRQRDRDGLHFQMQGGAGLKACAQRSEGGLQSTDGCGFGLLAAPNGGGGGAGDFFDLRTQCEIALHGGHLCTTTGEWLQEMLELCLRQFGECFRSPALRGGIRHRQLRHRTHGSFLSGQTHPDQCKAQPKNNTTGCESRSCKVMRVDLLHGSHLKRGGGASRDRQQGRASPAKTAQARRRGGNCPHECGSR